MISTLLRKNWPVLSRPTFWAAIWCRVELGALMLYLKLVYCIAAGLMCVCREFLLNLPDKYLLILIYLAIFRCLYFDEFLRLLSFLSKI